MNALAQAVTGLLKNPSAARGLTCLCSTVRSRGALNAVAGWWHCILGRRSDCRWPCWRRAFDAKDLLFGLTGHTSHLKLRACAIRPLKRTIIAILERATDSSASN